MRARLGAWLRKWADRLDDAGAPKRTPYSFTFESSAAGVMLRQDGRGCPLYYVGEADYARAHAEADTSHVVVDWRAASADSQRRPRQVFRYLGGGQAGGDER
jgi:hypothetical protein